MQKKMLQIAKSKVFLAHNFHLIKTVTHYIVFRRKDKNLIKLE